MKVQPYLKENEIISPKKDNSVIPIRKKHNQHENNIILGVLCFPFLFIMSKCCFCLIDDEC